MLFVWRILTRTTQSLLLVILSNSSSGQNDSVSSWFVVTIIFLFLASLTGDTALFLPCRDINTLPGVCCCRLLICLHRRKFDKERRGQSEVENNNNHHLHLNQNSQISTFSPGMQYHQVSINDALHCRQGQLYQQNYIE